VKIGVATAEFAVPSTKELVAEQCGALVREIEKEEKSCADKVARLRLELSKLTCLENGGE
jgi:hypothetical protein